MADATTPIRQSCDRCRGQKLRCVRDEGRDTGACTRCIRLCSQCVYSHSLPKGRPNHYFRVVGPGSEGADNGSGGPVGNALGAPAKRKAAAPIAREGSKGTSRGDGGADPATSLDATNNQSQHRTGSNRSVSGIGDAGTVDPLTTSAGQATPFAAGLALPWLGQWSWTDSMSNEEMEGLNALVGEHSDLPMQSSIFDEQPVALPDWGVAANTRVKAGSEHASQSVSHVLEPTLSLDMNVVENSNDSGGSNVLTPASDAKGPSAALAQLTQLSMRLHPLHSKSQALAETALCEPNWKTKQALVVDKDVFGTLMSPLIRDACSSASGSVSDAELHQSATLGEILQEAMYATHQLLDTMRHLQQHQHQQQRSKGNSPLTPAATPNSSRSAKGNQSSNPVVRHLILSCHGMLISIYTAVFEVLQRDADWLSPARPGERGLDHGPLGDARLVVIVQLCAYLVYRQQAAVDLYTSPGSRPNTGTSEGIARNTAANELESEMRVGLERLRTALRIQ